MSISLNLAHNKFISLSLFSDNLRTQNEKNKLYIAEWGEKPSEWMNLNENISGQFLFAVFRSSSQEINFDRL